MTAAGSFVYGTTQTGGTGHNGVVYQFDSTGAETILYNLTGGADGGEPTILSSDGVGNLYGTTVLGGTSTSCPVFTTAIGCGVVFSEHCEPDGNGPVHIYRRDRWGLPIREWYWTPQETSTAPLFMEAPVMERSSK